MRFRAKIASAWEAARESYWFVPALLTASAFGLGTVLVEIDRGLPHDWLRSITWLYTGSPDGARAVLSTIAGSLVGLAGVVFSITIVALVLASNQFGPRLLRNFMRDLGNQLVLGTFVGSFLYSLMVLRQVHGAGEEEGSFDRFIPQLSMLVALLLAVGALAMLIYFIHHISVSIQAPHVIAAVARDLRKTIDALYPQRRGSCHEEDEPNVPDARPEMPPDFEEHSVEVGAGRSGYLQLLEHDRLIRLARKRDLVLRVEVQPGDFLQGDSAVLRVWPASRAGEKLQSLLRESMVVSSRRSSTQDVSFALEQLLQVAIRSLSPGINDPFTAIMCIERIGEALSVLVIRPIPSPWRLDEDGRLRVIGPAREPDQLIDTAFSQLRWYARDMLDVLLQALQAIERIARQVRRRRDRAALAKQAELLKRQALAAADNDLDRSGVDAVHRRVVALLHDAFARPDDDPQK